MKIIDRLFLKIGYVPNHITRTLTCAWCAKSFEWSGKAVDNPPRFCSVTHQKRSSEARTKRKLNATQEPKVRPKREENLDLSQVGRCPTPFKITFRTYEEAKSVIQRVDPKMHVYRCPCGALHIGHRARRRK